MDIQTLLVGLGAVALTGLGLGFSLRLPVLVVTSAIVATMVCVTSVRAGSPVASAILLVFGDLFVLQGFYLAGLIISAWAMETLPGTPLGPFYLRALRKSVRTAGRSGS